MRQLPWIIVLIAIAASAGLWLGSQPASAPKARTYATFSAYPQPRAVSPFSLDGSDGRKIDSAQLRGRYQLVFFGFTHCPDIWPTTLAVFREISKKLPTSGLDQRVGFLFVSVDPERDNPQTLAEYARFFSKDIVAATADHERLGVLTRELGVLYVREQTESPDYNVDHSAAIFVIDPEGRLLGRFSPPLDADRILADLKTIAGP